MSDIARDSRCEMCLDEATFHEGPNAGLCLTCAQQCEEADRADMAYAAYKNGDHND